MLLHRHHITTILQLLLVLFAFASCVDNEYLGRTTSGSFYDKEYYLYLKIEPASDLSQTRVGSVEDSESAGSGDFVHGSEAEQLIDLSSCFIIFFDKDGNLFTNPIQDLADGGWDKENEDDYLTDDERAGEQEDKNYLEAGYKTKIYPNIDAAGNVTWPSECLLVLNGPNAEYLKDKIQNKIEGFDTKEGILSQVWDWDKDPKKIGRTEKGYFTMTNTAYIDEDANGNPYKQIATKIEEKHIQSVGDTKELNPEDMLRIRVERMTSKFSFAIENDNDNDNENDEKLFFNPVEKHEADPLIFFGGIEPNGKIEYVAIRKWRVKVTGWGINALETQNHIFKNIKIDGNYFVDWNDPSYYRSHWSEDPHYGFVVKDGEETNEVWPYPWQYRKAIDKKDLIYYWPTHRGEYSIEKDENLLRNYSYDDFTKDGFNEQCIYAPENTYKFDLYKHKYNDDGNENKLYLDNRTNLLAGTHLIVCAELQVEVKTPEGVDVYIAKDVYRDQNGFYYESVKDYFTMLVHTFNKTLLSQRTMDFTLYDWTEGGVVQKDLTAHTANQNATNESEEIIYQLYYEKEDGQYIPLTAQYISELSDEEFNEMFVMSPATIEHGDGRRLPWLDNNKLTIRTSADDETNKPLEIWTKDKIKNAENRIGYEITPGDKVTNVNMDDCIKSLLYEWLGAVDHFNNGRMYYAAEVLHNGKPNEEDANIVKTEELGDHGVVRNNWYKFKLKDIKRIGTPVDDPKQPIVPERIDNRDVINLKVDFLPWHIVETTAPLQ